MHSIAVFIANRRLSEEIKDSISSSKIFDLTSDLSIVALFTSSGESVWSEDIPKDEIAYSEFSCLTKNWDSVARRASQTGKVAYVETEYFGGAGAQSAVLFENGSITFGPSKDESGPRETWPINSVLRLLGVRSSLGSDEFETIGFTDVRENEDFF